jgi:putative ABC transport system ATP-binding protein
MGVDVYVRGVHKSYQPESAAPINALNNVSFELPAGTTVAVTGPSGSGKSTLLHVIGAMDEADSGVIRVGALDVMRLSRREKADYRRTVGFVFQRFHLLPALTALDNVIAPLLPHKTVFSKQERGLELLAAVGLADRSPALPSQLSGGEQQRVAIARALVNDPGLLLADEPTGNLDSETSMDIMDLVRNLSDERQMTILLATHDPLIASGCDRLISLQDGSVVEDFPVPREIEPETVLDRINRPGPGA